MKTRQLFFDLDRTLWDFETNSKKALRQLFSEHDLGQKIEHFNHFHHTYKRINANLWNAFGNGKISKTELRDNRFSKTLEYHSIIDAKLSQQLSNGYIELSPYQTTLFPNTIETLTALKKEKYRLHIITNGFPEVQHIKLSNSGLRDFFDEVICSEDIGITKPHREIFREAQRRTDCKTEHAVMIGDDFKADIIGALNAGWIAIHFDPECKIKKERNVPRIRDLSELENVIPLLPIVS